MLAASWRNPVDALDSNNDRQVTPFDVLVSINELNAGGARLLTESGPENSTVPYYDSNGDGYLTSLDPLFVINALNSQGGSPYTLLESSEVASERFVTIGLGQDEGSRVYRFEVDSDFDATDTDSIIEDTLAVYLQDLNDPNTTLLPRGEPGSSLFTLAGDRADYKPGRVRFDGRIVEIDLTEVHGHEAGRLVFQLINSDTDSGSSLIIRPLSNDVNPEGTASPVLDSLEALVAAGGELDFTALVETADLEVTLTNVRADTTSGQYRSELRIRNTGAPIGRDIAIELTGLPDGVTLRNASGTSPNGFPYLNLRDAVPFGGLDRGDLTSPIEVVIDSELKRFSLSARTFTGEANRPPQFEPVTPITVIPGGVVEVPLDARDPDGDRVQFTLTPGGSMPTGELRGSVILISAAPDDIGSYTFDVHASDGQLRSSRAVEVTVKADLVTSTRISGVVMNTDLVGLPGLPIELGSLLTTTDSDGRFQIEFDGAAPGDTLLVHGEAFTGSDDYPFIAEKLPLLLGRALFDGVNNVIARPIYLPVLDTEHGATIDPNRDTTVTTPAIPTASVFVAAGTLQDQQGEDYTGELSITAVPTDLTPAALPDNLRPDLVVTIQPGEMAFTAPAPLALPNRAGWPAGMTMDLWSINPQTGLFDNVGTGQVTADGSTVETVDGGIRNSSWHFFAPPVPDNDDRDPFNREDGCDDGCDSVGGFSSQVQLQTGAVIEQIHLPVYQSQGVDRGVQLVYDSLRADPRHIFHFGYKEVDRTPDIYMTASLSVERNGFRIVHPGYSDPQLGIGEVSGRIKLADGEHVWRAELGGPLKSALQIDLSDQPSGVFDYAVDYGIGIERACEFLNSVAVTYCLFGSGNRLSNEFAHVNTVDSPVGSGWGVAGLQSIVENDDGTILLIDGDGGEMIFQPPENEGESFTPPTQDFSDLVKLPDGTFQRTLVGQTVHRFDTLNRLSSVTDPSGNTTRYDYDSAGRLTRITDPVGLETSFSYDGNSGLLSMINDPAGRVSQFEHDSDGNLTRVVYPDGSERDWEYDGRHHITVEVDQRGFREQTLYDFAGRATEAIRKDGTSVTVQPLQTQLLLPPHITSPAVSVTTLSNEPRTVAVLLRSRLAGLPHAAAPPEPLASYVDAQGNVTQAELTNAGQVVSYRDGEGTQSVADRDLASGLITTVTDGRSNVTEFEYDDRGQLIRFRDSLSRSGGESLGLFEDEFQITDRHFLGSSAVGDLNGDGRADVATVGIFGVAVLLGQEDGTLAAPVLSGAPLQLISYQPPVLADLDGDDDLDVLIPDSGTRSTLVVFRNDGTGRLAPETVDIGIDLMWLTAGLVDGDTHVDLIVRDAANSLTVLFGDGNGAFPASTQVNLSDTVDTFIVVDVNGDSRNDIVSRGNSAGDPILIVLNDGARALHEASQINTSGEVAVNVADMNLDSKADLILVKTRAIDVLPGKGDGTFDGAVTTNIASRALLDNYGVADVNDDGLPDLVTAVRRLGGANSEPRLLSLFGDGSGAFPDSSEIRLPVRGSGVPSPALADVDGDGRVDVVTQYSRGIGVIRNLAGEYLTGINVTDPLRSVTMKPVALADIDDDLDLDILATHFYANTVTLTSYVNQGDGVFAFLATTVMPGNLYPDAVFSGDLNGDNFTDLVFGTSPFEKARAVTLLNNGDGTFQPMTVDSISTSATVIGLLELTGDQEFDLLMATEGPADDLVVLAGNGDGTFGGPAPAGDLFLESLGGISAITRLADVDHDGITDLVAYQKGVVASIDNLEVHLGTAAGQFVRASGFHLNSQFIDIALGDMTDDGGMDLVTLAIGQDALEARVLTGHDDGTFDTPDLAVVSELTDLDFKARLHLDDFDGDRRLDILHTARNGVSVELGQGDGTFGDAQGYLISEADKFLAFGDLNSDSKPDFVATDNFGVYPRLNSPTLVAKGPGEQQIVRDPVFGVPLSIVDELGRPTLFEIDATTGKVLSERRVVGQFDPTSGGDDDLLTHFTYTADGRLETFTTADGVATQFSYDVFGRKTSVTRASETPDAGLQQFEYNAAGRMIAAIDELGRRTEFEYDAMNRVTRLIDPAGNDATFAYDAVGNLVQQVDIQGQITTSTYDALNRVTMIQQPLGLTTRFGYNMAGQLTQVTDPLGRVTDRHYDTRGRLIESKAPDGSTTQYRYDADDNLTQITDPGGSRTTRLYDARNRQVGSFDALGNVSRVTFDAADRLISRTDRNGRTITRVYDDLDRMMRETWIDSDGAETQVINYTYDRVGQLIEVSDGVSMLSFEYDARRRIIGEIAEATAPVRQYRIDYTYDATGNRLSMQPTVDGMPDALTTYGYGAVGRLSQIFQRGGGGEKRVDYTYEASGLISTIERFSDLAGTQPVVASTYAYDPLSRLTDIVHQHDDSDLAIYALSYDDAGRITAIADIDDSTNYDYDEVDRLTTATPAGAGGATESYTYDRAGNRTASHRAGGGTTIGGGNRLLNDGVRTYAYDAEGNLVEQVDLATGHVRRFEYNHLNSLVRVVDVDASDLTLQTVHYLYDPFGRRIGMTVELGSGQQMTRGYIYDGRQVILEFLDADGAGAAESPQQVMRYLNGPGVDRVLAQEDAVGEVVWLLQDHQGTVRDLVDNDGLVLNHRTYDSFGNLVSETNAAVTSRYGYTGRTFDGETGLYYYRTRYYDPLVGRFMSEDLIGLRGGLNLYAYVLNNPLRFRDPFGLQQSLLDDPRGSDDSYYDGGQCPFAFNPIDEESEMCLNTDGLHFGPGNQLLDEGISPRNRRLAGRCGAFGNRRRRLPPRGPSGTCQSLPAGDGMGSGGFDCQTAYDPRSPEEQAADACAANEDCSMGEVELDATLIGGRLWADLTDAVDGQERFEGDDTNLGGPRQ